MQPHGGKSCPCGCIARFLHLRFLPLKLVHQHKHMLKIIPFFPPHLIIHPPYCPCIIFHPQRTLPPPPTDYPNARLACIVGVRRWRQRESGGAAAAAAAAAVAAARLRDVGGSLAAALRWRRTARRWQRGGSSVVAAAVAAARHRDVGGSLAAARDGPFPPPLFPLPPLFPPFPKRK
jgi:hypothetical protein